MNGRQSAVDSQHAIRNTQRSSLYTVQENHIIRDEAVALPVNEQIRQESISRMLLTVVVFVYAFVAGLYAVWTPKWQAPDEPAHFNYVRTLAESGSLPILEPGDYDQGYLEQIKAAKFPPSMSIDRIRYESYQPPLYYIAATPIYLAVRGGGLDAAVLALRLFSTALGLFVLLLAFAIVRTIFPDSVFLPLATVGAIATIPMHIAVTASISNDIAAEVVLAAILLVAVLRIKGEIGDRRYVLLGGILFGAALLTKTTTYVPSVLLLAGAALVRRRLHKPTWRPVLSTLLLLFGLGVAIALPMFLRNMATYGAGDPLGMGRHDAIVLGQPTTLEMGARLGWERMPFEFTATTFRSFWGQFGWMGVLMDDRLYKAYVLLTVSTFVGLGINAVQLWRRRGSLSRLETAALALMVLFLLAAVVDYAGYNLKFYQPQGRYLFPAIIPIALLAVLGLRALLPERFTKFAFASLYVVMVGLDLAALFLYIVPQLRVSG